MSRRSSGAQIAFRVGIPLIGFLCSGVYVLSTFFKTANERKDKERQSMTIRKYNLEEEHKQIMKSLDIDDYKLSRIPRPDDPNSVNNNSTRIRINFDDDE